MQSPEWAKDILFAHSQHPCNCALPTSSDFTYPIVNPNCGDAYTFYVESASGTLAFHFTGAGCILSKASASLAMDALAMASVPYAHELTSNVLELIQTGTPNSNVPDDLHALLGVSAFPQRVICASLAWNAVKELMTHYHV